MKPGFWLRWSLRDLRERWLQVVAIAMIIALGTGVFAGLGSQQEWREASYARSYNMLNMYDLRMQFTDNTSVEQAEIESLLAEINGIQSIETRLISPTLVDASTDDEKILVAGRLVGVDVRDGGPHVNNLNIKDGHMFSAQDRDIDHTNPPPVIVDYLFARYYELEPEGTIEIGGAITLDFIGTAQSPEYFMIQPDDGSFLGESNFAVLYLPLEAVQTILNREGQINDVVLLIAPGADRDSVRQAIDAAMQEQFPDAGFEFINKEEDSTYQLLHEDAEGDQQMFNIIGFLFLFGAAMAAFNLIGRIVQSQRRQIGIGMALGVQRHWLALRPMLMALQIALLGTVFGLLAGYGLSQAFATVFDDFIPLPYWDDTFYLDSYLQGALLGILIPFVATLYPVWQAVRVQPVDAIKTGTLISKGGGLAPAVQSVSLPGKSFVRMPLRNLLRAPWRTLLTVLGIGIAILMMIAMSGMLDTFTRTIAEADEAYLNTSEDRIMVVLDGFYNLEDETVTAVQQATDTEGQALFTETTAGIALSGELQGTDDPIPVDIEFIDMDNPLWQPQLLEGEYPAVNNPGVVLSEKAANDLDVEVGDTITLSHPVRVDENAFRRQVSELRVAAIHDIPLRGPLYMRIEDSGLVGGNGMVNYLLVNPVISDDAVREILFTQEHIIAVQSVKQITVAFEEALSLLQQTLQITQGIVLLLAFLIAFNSTSINLDERVREIATMFAFGLPVRTVIRMQVLENIITGLLGTLVGLLLGYITLQFLFQERIQSLVPDIQFSITVGAGTIIIAGLLGVLVVSLTPLLSIRRMVSMDIPSRLRVME